MLIIPSGELEGTLLIHSAKFSNIITLLKDDEESRALLLGMVESIEAIEDEEKKSFRTASSIDVDNPIAVYQPHMGTSLLPPNDFEQLRTLRLNQNLPCISNDIVDVEEISFRGVRYGAFSSRHFRDSSVIFQVQDTHAAGVIEKLFSYTSQTFDTNSGGIEFYAIIQEHAPISGQGEDDPYLAFGYHAGYLCEKTFRRRHMISVTDVISHFVLTPILDTQYIHVLPVDKVGVLIFLSTS